MIRKNNNILKSLDLTFYKTIIKSDFFLVNSKYIKNSLKKKHFVDICTIDIFSLIKSIRQFIRLLQFAKKETIHYLFIRTQTWGLFYLVTSFVQKYPSKFKIRVQESFTIANKKKYLNASKIILILDTASPDNPNKDPNLITKLLLDRFFLVQKISINKNFSLLNNSYFIYNDLLDFKKILFIILLINKVSLIKLKDAHKKKI